MVPNTSSHLNAAFDQSNEHTWNIFFSAPLCLVYSFGRNSFRLQREIAFGHGYPHELQTFPFLSTYLQV